MPDLADQDIRDLLTGTLNELGRLRFNQIATTLQNYEVMGRIMKKDKMQFDSGVGIKRTIMVDHSNAAKDNTLYETDTVNVADQLETISIPWRHCTTNHSYERREMLMNRGAARIVNLMKVRRADAMISLAELMENRFWNAPPSSTDKLRPFGIPYWVVKYPSGTTTPGFNGGNHTNFSSGPGGLDASTFTRWKSYTGQYTDVTKDDLIAKMRTAYMKIRFKSPVDIPDYRKGTGQQYRVYTNLTKLQDMEKLGEAQNENLGRDLAPMDDVMAFRRNPIIWVPELDSDTDNPVYMLNFQWIYPVFLRGDYLREAAPEKAANQHNVFTVHVDLTWNILCTDRRSQACLSTGDTNNPSA